MFITKAVKNLKPYIVSSHDAWEIDDKSEVLKLDWNESTIQPSPDVIRDVTHHVMNGHLNWYPDVDNSYLRRKIADYNHREVEEVEYFASSDALHEYVIKAFCEHNSTILMLSPTYDNFRAVSESSGISVLHHEFDFLQTKNNTYDSISKSLLHTKPTIVYICNPNNPTGTVFDLDLLEGLVSDFPNVLFLIDEAYFEFTKVTVSGLISHYNNIIICRTFSKAFGLASFRIGYAISNVTNINALRKVKNHKNISSLAQTAAIAALGDIDYMESYVNDVLSAKKEFLNFLNTKPSIEYVEPQGGNFVLVNFGTSKDRLIEILKGHKIFIRDFKHLNNMKGYARITIGTIAQTQKLIKVLDEYV